MGMMTRVVDLLNSNVNAFLEKAESSPKLLSLYISDMDSLLTTTRADAAKCIANKKQAEKRLAVIIKQQTTLSQQAETALRNDREDLAKHALLEKQTCIKQQTEIEAELEHANKEIEKFNDQLSEMQSKLQEMKAQRDKVNSDVDHPVAHWAADPVTDELNQVSQRYDKFVSRENSEVAGSSKLAEQIESLEKQTQLDDELSQLKQKINITK